MPKTIGMSPRGGPWKIPTGSRCSEIHPPAVKGLPCPSTGGKHCCSHLHKSPGTTAFAPPEQAHCPDKLGNTGNGNSTLK